MHRSECTLSMWDLLTPCTAVSFFFSKTYSSGHTAISILTPLDVHVTIVSSPQVAMLPALSGPPAKIKWPSSSILLMWVLALGVHALVASLVRRETRIILWTSSILYRMCVTLWQWSNLLCDQQACHVPLDTPFSNYWCLTVLFLNFPFAFHFRPSQVTWSSRPTCTCLLAHVEQCAGAVMTPHNKVGSESQ